MSIRHKFSKDTPRAVGVPSTAVRRWLVDRVVAAGGDPDDVPEMPFKMLRINQVSELTGVSQATIYRLMAKGEFPRQVPLGQMRGATESCNAA